MTIIGFIVSLIRKRNDVADILWGMYFVLAAVVVFVINSPGFDFRLLVLGMVVIWAVRLSSHILSRHAKTTEDPRYLAWRKQWGDGWYFYARSYAQVFLLQGILALIVVSPVLIIMKSVLGIVPVWLVIGSLVWLGGFIFEWVADHQLKQFITTPHELGSVMQSGLWAYSRHPNYFGEIVQWWGLFIVALGVPFGIFGVIGPGMITLLIVFVSGIPLAEKSFLTNPQFQEYAKKTSPLIPFPKMLMRAASPKTLAAILIEFGPLLLFFVTFELFDFFTSVIILMVAMIFSLVGSIKLHKKVSVFPLVASGSVIVFGLLTVFLKNPFFIIFKDTLYFGVFGLAILIPYLVKKNLVLKKMFVQIFAITDRGWKWVSINWAILMIAIAVSNEIARQVLSVSGWVTYKMVVLFGIIVFSGVQLFIARRERLPDASSWGLRIDR